MFASRCFARSGERNARRPWRSSSRPEALLALLDAIAELIALLLGQSPLPLLGVPSESAAFF